MYGIKFSSPHGDFSFSIQNQNMLKHSLFVFVPSRGFLFFYEQQLRSQDYRLTVFVPSRGFLFFYGVLLK